MTDLIELAERCEAAAASEQQALLDEAFDAALGPRRVDKGGWTRWHDQWFRYRKMLDAEAYESAALTLVPEGWGHGYSTTDDRLHTARASCWTEGNRRRACEHAATPALALCAAALRARANGDAPDE